MGLQTHTHWRASHVQNAAHFPHHWDPSVTINPHGAPDPGGQSGGALFLAAQRFVREEAGQSLMQKGKVSLIFTLGPPNAHTTKKKATGHYRQQSVKSFSDTCIGSLLRMKRRRMNRHPQSLLDEKKKKAIRQQLGWGSAVAVLR